MMQVFRFNLRLIDREKRLYLMAILLSVFLHVVFFLLFKVDLFDIDFSSDADALSEEVTVLFPENKPKQIVENINENEEMPIDSDLLSDRNSRAANPLLLSETSYLPFSEGNIPIPNLSNPGSLPILSSNMSRKKFSREALVNGGTKSDVAHSFNLDGREAVNQQLKEQESSNNIYEQKIFSADQLGDLTLSTYSWEWAPYINALKRKLHQVWFTPPAYYQLGLIHGYTTIRFSISKSGDLIEYAVLEHKGHESLEQSSINAIKSSFPFKPLPARFPDDKLTITARLIYPNLRERIH